MLSSFATDLRYSVRSLWKNRAISVLAVVCLALGVGLNATMFSVVDGVLIQGLPFRDMPRLGRVWSANLKARTPRAGVSYEDFRDMRDGTTSFEAVTLSQFRSLTIADGGGEPERLAGAAISWHTFEMLGVRATKVDPIIALRAD